MYQVVLGTCRAEVSKKGHGLKGKSGWVGKKWKEMKWNEMKWNSCNELTWIDMNQVTWATSNEGIETHELKRMNCHEWI